MKALVLLSCLVISSPGFASEMDVLASQLRFTAENAPIQSTAEESHFELVGRGIQDKKTGDSIALACAGDLDVQSHSRKCDQIRHVYFKAGAVNAVWVGDIIHVNFDKSIPSQKQIKKAVKELNRSFKRARKERNHNRNTYIYGGVGAFGIAPAIWFLSPDKWMVAAAGGLPPVVGIYMGAVIVWAVAAAIASNHAVIHASGGLGKVFLDQNGWNWSDDPKTLSSRNFNIYKDAVIHDNSI